MFTQELKDLLIQVITSWQVLAVTAAVLLYCFLVNYVAKLYHRPKASRGSRSKKNKKSSPAAEPSSEEAAVDELDLEE